MIIISNIVKGVSMGLINKDTLQAIRAQEMDRKDFLKYIGLVLIGLVGYKTFVSILLNAGNKDVSLVGAEKREGSGFGSGSYGK